MSKNEKKKTIAEQIADLKKLIVATTDKTYVAKLLDQLLSLQKQADVEPVELIVPCKEVLQVADYESFSIKETVRGYLFQYKSGGYSVFVGKEYGTVASMLATALELKEKNEWDEVECTEYSAICEIFQAPFFAALGMSNPQMGRPLDYDAFFTIATAIVKARADFQKKYLQEAVPHEETEEDIQKNNEAAMTAKGLAAIADTPLPPEI